MSMHEIPIEDKEREFAAYLLTNKRIIFSAPFGDGKTYFLNKFFEGNEHFYVIKLRPVNYSVAENADVFEYIKRDILHQLWKDGKIRENDLATTLKNMLSYEGIDSLLTFMLSFLPHGELLNKVKTIVEEATQKYKDNKNLFPKYEQAFEYQRGGLYEHDAYTELIRKILEVVKKEGKQIVLVIDDLDRLDPAHLFRILNVISAHIDEEENANKFGFDNIVLAMDYMTTNHIFHHFYGADANYEGYMSKFTSAPPFYYSITQIARKTLWDIISREAGEGIPVKKFPNLIKKIEDASIRDCKKCIEIQPNMLVKQENKEIGGVRFGTNHPLLKLLLYMNQLEMSLKEISEDLSAAHWKDAPKDYLAFMAPLFCATKYIVFKIDEKEYQYAFENKNQINTIPHSHQVTRISNNELGYNMLPLTSSYRNQIPQELYQIWIDHVHEFDDMIITGGWQNKKTETP